MSGEERDARVVLTADTSQYNRELQGSARATQETETAVSRLTDRVANLQRVAGTGIAIVSTASLASITAATYAASQFESQLSTLHAQATITGRSLDMVARPVDNIRRQLPVATEAVVGLVTALQKLGVNQSNVERIATTFVKLSAATGEDMGSLATGMIELQRRMGTSHESTDKFANSLVTLSANMGVSATGITSFAQAMAPIARTVGMSQTEVMGFSAAMSKAGQDGFLAANTFTKMLNDIARAARYGSTDLALYAAVAGKTVDAFKGMSASDQLISITEGISRAGDDSIKVLDQMGFDGARAVNTIRGLAQTGSLRSSVNMAASGFQNTDALERGSRAAMSGLNDSVTVLQNRFTSLAQDLGSMFLPTATLVTKSLSAVTDAAHNLISPFTELGTVLAPLLMAGQGALNKTGGAVSMATTAGMLYMLGRNTLTAGFATGWRGGDIGALRSPFNARTAASIAEGGGSRIARGMFYAGQALGSAGQAPLTAIRGGVGAFNVMGRAGALAQMGMLGAFSAGRLGTDPFAPDRVFDATQRRTPHPFRQNYRPAWNTLRTGMMPDGSRASFRGMVRGGFRTGGAQFLRGVGYNAAGMVGAGARALGTPLAYGAGRVIGGIGSFAMAHPVMTAAALGYGAYSVYQNRQNQMEENYARRGDVNSAIGPMAAYAAALGDSTIALRAFTDTLKDAESEIPTTRGRAMTATAEDVAKASSGLREYTVADVAGMNEAQASAWLTAQFASTQTTPAQLQAAKLDVLQRFPGLSGVDMVTQARADAGPGMPDISGLRADQQTIWQNIPGLSNERAITAADRMMGASGPLIAEIHEKYGSVAANQARWDVIDDLFADADKMSVQEMEENLRYVSQLLGYSEAERDIFQGVTGTDDVAQQIRSRVYGMSQQDSGSHGSAVSRALVESGGMGTREYYEVQNVNRGGIYAINDWLNQRSGTSGGYRWNTERFSPNNFDVIEDSVMGRMRGTAVNYPMTWNPTLVEAMDKPADVDLQIRAARELVTWAEKGNGLNIQGYSNTPQSQILDDARSSRLFNTDGFAMFQDAINAAGYAEHPIAVQARRAQEMYQSRRAEQMAVAPQFMQGTNILRDYALSQSYTGEGMEAVREERRGAVVGWANQTEMNLRGIYTQMKQFDLQRDRGEEDFARQRQQTMDDYARQREYTEIDWNKSRQRQDEDYYRQQKYQDIDFALSRERSDEDRIQSLARSEEDFNRQRVQSLDDFGRQRERSDADYTLQRERGTEDFTRQQQYAQDDFNLSRQRSEEDFNHQREQMALQYARSMTDIFKRVQVQPSWSGSNLLVNAQDQLSQMVKQQSDLEQLRELGVDGDVIKMLGLNQFENAQQLARFLSDLAADPSLVDTWNSTIQDRINIADALMTDEDNTAWTEFQRQFELTAERAAEDFERMMDRSTEAYQLGMDRMADDYEKMSQRSEEDFQRMLDRNDEQYRISLDRMNEDYTKMLTRSEQDFQTSRDRQNEAYRISVTQMTDDHSEMLRRQDEMFTQSMDRQIDEWQRGMDRMSEDFNKSFEQVTEDINTVSEFILSNLTGTAKEQFTLVTDTLKGARAALGTEGEGMMKDLEATLGPFFSNFDPSAWRDLWGHYGDGGGGGGGGGGGNNNLMGGGEGGDIMSGSSNTNLKDMYDTILSGGDLGLSNGWAFPVMGAHTWTSPYGMRRHPTTGKMAMHTGQDLAAASGTGVATAGTGIVEFAGIGGTYGNLIKVYHGNGDATWYAHLSRIGVKEGDIVAGGQRIGDVGSTGRSTGPHLHFEHRRDGAHVDPSDLLNGKGVNGMDPTPFINAFMASESRARFENEMVAAPFASGYESGMMSMRVIQAIAAMTGNTAMDQMTWHKDGALVNKPTILGVGEAGAEAIIPLNRQGASFMADTLSRFAVPDGIDRVYTSGRQVVKAQNVTYHQEIDQGVHIHGQVNVSAADTTEFYDKMNERKRFEQLTRPGR